MGVEAEPFFAQYLNTAPGPVAGVPPGSGADRPKLADKFGWKPGDRSSSESIPAHRKSSGPLEFVVRRHLRYHTPVSRHGIECRCYHFVPLRGRGTDDRAGTYTVEIDDPGQAGTVSGANILSENTDA
jgi:hypothetical protein